MTVKNGQVQSRTVRDSKGRSGTVKDGMVRDSKGRHGQGQSRTAWSGTVKDGMVRDSQGQRQLEDPGEGLLPAGEGHAKNRTDRTEHGAVVLSARTQPRTDRTEHGAVVLPVRTQPRTDRTEHGAVVLPARTAKNRQDRTRSSCTSCKDTVKDR